MWSMAGQKSAMFHIKVSSRSKVGVQVLKVSSVQGSKFRVQDFWILMKQFFCCKKMDLMNVVEMKMVFDENGF